MKKHPYTLSTDEDVILLPVLLDSHEIQLALDTASTQTIIDLNVLLMTGYAANDALGTLSLETANGIMQAQIFQVQTLDALDTHRTNVEIVLAFYAESYRRHTEFAVA